MFFLKSFRDGGDAGERDEKWNRCFSRRALGRKMVKKKCSLCGLVGVEKWPKFLKQRVSKESTDGRDTEKGVKSNDLTPSFSPVGVTGFEPATTRPPDAYSNRAELHPELRLQR
jgi:hypothetical protein